MKNPVFIIANLTLLWVLACLLAALFGLLWLKRPLDKSIIVGCFIAATSGSIIGLATMIAYMP